MKRNMKIRSMLWVLLILLTIALLAPFFYSISLSIPGSDDFSTGWVTKINENETLLKKAIDIANASYINWGGSWTGFFLQVLLDPLNLSPNYLNVIGFEMVCFFALFVVSYSVLINIIVRHCLSCKDALLRAAIILCSLAVVLFSDAYTQVFYWFTGSGYSWYLSFAMLFAAFTIKDMFGHGSMINSIGMFLFGILACQSINLDVAAGIFVLFVIIREVKTNHPHTKMMTFLLVLMVVSGCSSAFAPGNFARFDGNIGDIDFVWSMKHSVLECIDELRLLSANSSLFILFAALFCLGTRLEKDNSLLKTVAVLLLLAGISVFGIVLPTVIGYRGTNFPNRIRFLFVVVFTVYLSIAVLVLGSMSKKWILKSRWFFPALTVVSILLLVINGNYKNNAYYRTVAYATEAKVESEAYKDIFREIERSEEDDVVIVIDASEIPCSGIIELPNFSMNFWNPVNQSIAGFYGKNSIRFEWV